MSCLSSSGSEEEDENIDSYRKGGYHAVRVGDSFAGGRYIAQRKLGGASSPPSGSLTIADPPHMLLLKSRKVHHNLLKLLFMKSKFFLQLLMVTPQIASMCEEDMQMHFDWVGLSAQRTWAKRAVARISGRQDSIGGVGRSSKVERCLDGIDMRCKVVDFGNACWKNKSFAVEIQTRQYRSPEDHLALMMELLGKVPRKMAISGASSKDYFDRHGDLKNIRRLKYCSLDRLLVNKYKFSDIEARELAEFLCPLLDFAPEKRPTALQCLQHPWLNIMDMTQKEVKSEPNLQKVDVGMSKLQIKVGK
ncbi:protein kinase superfamily protein [Actinidia rufa]|uniref:non-specific serine/threonine protein kinase n=1 Tax=Actinidia rufa TaxID=165716 RepID=A0A7J0DIB6_9ERIC|nr:protein kinase superfamily protein [Actinidia rufa]